MQIQTVLAPVDFSSLMDRELDIATDICRAFGARLVVHHNLETAGLGAAMTWMRLQERHGVASEAAVEDGLLELLAALPEEIAPQAVITRGLVGPAVLCVGDEVKADLIILATHGASNDDHRSVAEQVLESAKCPVLAIHQASAEQRRLRLGPAAPRAVQAALVPTDFSADSRVAVEYAFELARRLPLQLHLLHVVTPARVATGETPATMAAREGAAGEEASGRLMDLVPADLAGRVETHIGFGDPVAEIAVVAQRLGVAYIVMGGHARGLLRRRFTRDTSRQVLRQVECPVWFVPAASELRV